MSAVAADPGARQGSRALLATAGVLALAAVALPGSWITGEVEAGDPRKLVLGSWLLRGALLAVAALLALAPRIERPPSAAPRGEDDPGRATLWIAGIVGLAAALRVHRLDAPLWFDEIWMLVDSVRPPIPDTLRSFTTDNNHPLYSFLAAVCVRVFGESAWVLRLPAAVFGVASVAATYAFAKRLLGTRTALTAAALLALVWIHVDFSQNARAYTGLLLFTVTGSHALVVALETGSRRAWLAHGVSLALCVMLHLTGVFAAVGHVAVIAWYAFRRRESTAPGGLRAALLGLGLGTLLAFAAYALVLPQVIHFFLLRPERVAVKAEWTSPFWFVNEIADRLGFGRAVGMLLLAVAGLVAAGRRAAALPLLFVVPCAAVAAAMLGLGRNLWPRLFFFAAAFAVLVAIEGALAAARLLGRVVEWILAAVRPPGGSDTRGRIGPWLERAVPVFLVLACATMASPTRAWVAPKQDYEAALRWLEAERRPGEAVVSAGEMTRFVYADYFRTDFVFGQTREDLDVAIPAGRSGYAVYSFPVFVDSRYPELWTALQTEGREVARFPGSIGGGDVVVLRIER